MAKDYLANARGGAAEGGKRGDDLPGRNGDLSHPCARGYSAPRKERFAKIAGQSSFPFHPLGYFLSFPVSSDIFGDSPNVPSMMVETPRLEAKSKDVTMWSREIWLPGFLCGVVPLSCPPNPSSDKTLTVSRKDLTIRSIVVT
jgi:hypothetical protein